MHYKSQLHHFPLSAASRLIRLQLAEYQYDFTLINHFPWKRDENFLAINPSGSFFDRTLYRHAVTFSF